MNIQAYLMATFLLSGGLGFVSGKTNQKLLHWFILQIILSAILFSFYMVTV